MTKVNANDETLTNYRPPSTGEEETLTRLPESAALDLLSAAWQTGDIIDDKYEVREEIGRGGMGIVYRVAHLDWHVDLALKIPLFQSQGEFSRGRYMAEAQTWIDLGIHPNIVQCWYVRNINDVLCLFSDFISGGSLKEWITDGRINAGEWEKIIDVAIQACDGLAYAHSKGVIHRDVKPANMLMTPDGRLCVTDFGLATTQGAQGVQSVDGQNLQSRGGTLTITGMGIGTPQYAAPEQWDNARTVDIRADIYAFGVMLYELACGRRPFDDRQDDESPITIIGRHLTSSPPDPRSFFPEIPEEIVALTLACLAKEPADRPATLPEVRHELTKIYSLLSGWEYPRPAPDPAELRADSLNNKAVSLWDLNKKEEALKLFKDALIVDPQHLEATKNWGLIQWQQAKMTDAEFLARFHDLQSRHQDRAAYWRMLGEIEVARCDMEAGGKHLKKAFQIKPNDTMAQRLQDVVVQRLRENRHGIKKIRSIPVAGNIVSFAFNFDEMTGFLGCRDGSIKIWDCMHGHHLFSFKAHSETINSLALTKDGNYLISGSDDWLVGVSDTRTGKLRTLFEGHEGPVKSVSLSAMNDVVISGGVADHMIRSWHLDKQTCVGVCKGYEQIATGRDKDMLAIACHPSDNIVISASADRNLRLINTQKGFIYQTLQGHADVVVCVAFTPDGEQAVSGGKDKKIIRWDLKSAHPECTYEGHTDTVSRLTVTPDNRHIISCGADKTMRVWDLHSGVCLRTVFEHDCILTNVMVSPCGTLVAATGDDRKIHLWQLGFKPSAVQLDLAKVQEVNSAGAAQQDFTCHLSRARRALEDKNFLQCFEEISQARRISGFECDQRQLDIWWELTKNFTRCGLINGWNKRILKGHSDRVTSVDINAAGTLAASGSDDSTVRLWDLSRGQCIYVYDDHVDAVKTVAFSPDGNTVILGSADDYRPDETLRILDLKKEDGSQHFKSRTGYIRCVTFVNNQSVFTEGTASTGALWLRDVSTGECIQRYEGHSGHINAIAIDPLGEYIVTGSADAMIRIWHLKSGKCMHILEGHKGPVYSVAISPDRLLCLSSGEDRSIRIWNFNNGECLLTWRNGQHPAKSIAFSSDGQYCFSTDRQMIYLWDLSTATKTASFKGHAGDINQIKVFMNDRFMISAADDGLLYLWEMEWDITPHEKKKPLLSVYGSGPSKNNAGLRKNKKRQPSGITKTLKKIYGNAVHKLGQGK